MGGKGHGLTEYAVDGGNPVAFSITFQPWGVRSSKVESAGASPALTRTSG